MSSGKPEQNSEIKGLNLGAPIWLVKSGGRIIGPYSADEISKRLRSRELATIDEVTRPQARWRIIRDEPVFHKVVEEVRRNLMSAREDTEVQGSSDGLSATLPDFENTASGFEVVLPAASSDSQFSLSEVKDVEFVESEVDGRGTRRKENGVPSDFRQFGVSSEVRSAASSKSITRMFWLLALIVIVTVSLVWYRTRDVGTVESAGRGKDFAHVLQEANADWRRGDFPAALTLYKVADRLRPHDAQVVARLAPLWIHLETQTASAKRELLETIEQLPPDVSPSLRGDLQMGVGLAALASDDLSEAEANFRTALVSVPASTTARFDYAMAAFKERQFAEAARRFSQSGESPQSLLMFALSLISADSDPHSVGRHVADDAIKKILAKSQDYLQEAQIVGSYLASEAGESKTAVMRLRAALDTDPDLTAQHWHEPLQFLEPLAWRELIPYCQSLSEGLKFTAAQALFGLCLFKGGDHEKAETVIEEALGAASEDSLLRSVNAYMLASEERFEDARASLKLAMAKPNPPRLALLLRARLCQRGGDTNCAEEVYTDLSKLNPPVMAAMSGLAEIAAARGDSAAAKEWLSKAKELSPNYLPVLGSVDAKKGSENK